jgi:hypothetical protein
MFDALTIVISYFTSLGPTQAEHVLLAFPRKLDNIIVYHTSSFHHIIKFVTKKVSQSCGQVLALRLWQF